MLTTLIHENNAESPTDANKVLHMFLLGIMHSTGADGMPQAHVTCAGCHTQGGDHWSEQVNPALGSGPMDSRLLDC